MLFALGIALGMTSISHWFNKVRKIEAYTRKITGIIFIIIGVYFIYIHIILEWINLRGA